MCEKQSKKVAVVTGGSRGIGRVLVQTLANTGMQVFFNYSSPDDTDARQTEAMVLENGGFCRAFRANISKNEDVDGFIKEVINQANGIHILINNAGVTKDGLLVTMRESHWDQVMDTNLRGAYLCTKAALKPMIRQRWGRIINISSVVGITGNAGQCNYVAAKAGLIGFTKSVAQEMASRQITANVVAPGFIQSQMTDSMTEHQKQNIINRIPMQRIGTPEDVAACVSFLASDEAGYITGQVFQVCGGLAM